MQSMKETASNVAASARAGMEKTKATLGEKTEKMTTRDPVKREMAAEKKEDRINQAELEKREAREHNAGIRDAASVGANHPGYVAKGPSMNSPTYSATGHPGHGTGAHQMSALPGHGTGRPAGAVTDGTATAHPTTNWTGQIRAMGDRDYQTGGGYSG